MRFAQGTATVVTTVRSSARDVLTSRWIVWRQEGDTLRLLDGRQQIGSITAVEAATGLLRHTTRDVESIASS